MHELSVAISLVEAVEEEAERHSGRVCAVHLRLGPLSGVVKDALSLAFEVASAGTSVDGARLVVEEMPVVIYCGTCKSRQPVSSMQWMCCPVCATPGPEVVQGKELDVSGLEMEDAE